MHHCALLLGYGAGAINPYLAFETLNDMIQQRIRQRHPRDRGQELHQGAQQGHAEGDVQDGHLDAPEPLRRAGVRSHRARARLRRQHFTRTASRIAGVGSAVIAEDVRRRTRAFPVRRSVSTISTGAANTSGAATANTISSTPRPSSSSSTRRARVTIRSLRGTRLIDDQSKRLAPCADCSS